ncbi:hypothetical protein AAG906_038934 [Vitis piasezkii]
MEHEIYKSANTLRSYYQIGGKLRDFIIALHGSKAVKTFCSRMHFSLGAGCSATEGPVGRVLEADLQAGDGVSQIEIRADLLDAHLYTFKKAALQEILDENGAQQSLQPAKIDDFGRIHPQELNEQNIEALVAENNLDIALQK